MSKVELKKKWWITNRPKNAKGVELEKALGLVDDANAEKRAASLAALKPAIAKACAELEKLDKKGNGALLKELSQLEDMADAEAKKLQADAAKAKVAAKAAEKTSDTATEGVDAEEETSAEKMFDPELHRNTLKRATRQPLVFAFSVSTKSENRHLALGTRGMPAAFGRLTKARSEGAKVCFGRAQAAPGEASKLLLLLDSVLVPGTVKAFRLYLKENKLTLFRKVAVIVAGQEAESESDDDDTPVDLGATAETAAGGVAPEQAAASAASVTPPTPQQIEVLEDRRREFKRARAQWVAVKLRAEQDLEKVKDGAHMAYMADASQFPKIVAGCKQIDAILDNLDDELRDTLDQYASTPLHNQKKLQGLAVTAAEILERYQRFVANDKMMQAIDHKEFADVTVHAPVTKALADLRKAFA